MPSPLLELRHVSKYFGATRALHDVSIDLYGGEVHALAGENGAGKSTLLRILCGVITDFDGELRVDGRRRHFRRPADAAASGIAAIHQELSLVGPMSIGDNLLLGTGRRSLFGFLPRTRLNEKVRELLRQAGIDVDPATPVEALPLATRQLLEIEKALAQNARVVIMDEPTSALSDDEAERLLSRTDRLRKQGRAVLYISHRTEEIHRIGDRVSVLRDGSRVATVAVAGLEPGDLIRWMLGRPVTVARKKEPIDGALGESLLRVEGLRVRDAKRPNRWRLDGVSFEAKSGEVVGIAGLRGAGAPELLHTLYGSFGPIRAGEIRLAGRPFSPKNPVESLCAGVVLLASDRRSSVMPNLSIRENVSLSVLKELSRLGWVQRGRELERVRQTTDRVRLRPPSVEVEAQHLSGGNQQKTAIARCLLARPRLLLLDEPTRGIDIGAKSDIYALVHELAREGLTVLLVASELEELLLLSHRVLVLAEGRLVANLAGADITRERILEASSSRAIPTSTGAGP